MTPDDLLSAIRSSYHDAVLANHVLLLILWMPGVSEERSAQQILRQVQEEKYDESFFGQAAEQVSERSPELGQAFRKRLDIFRLESGSLTPHQAYFRAISRCFADILCAAEDEGESTARSVMVETVLNYLEDEGPTHTSRSCPVELISLMSHIAGQSSFQTVYDPRSAAGRLLLGLAGHMESALASHVTGFGQSPNENDIFHAQLRAYCWGREMSFQTAEAIQSPPSTPDGALRQFDLVVADLSCGADAWPHEVGEADPYGRFRFGLPSRLKGEFAFIQHMLGAMRKTSGMTLVIVDQSILIRSGKDAEIRRAIIESNLLDAVIFLPRKLYRSDTSAQVILVFKASKAEKSIFFINASEAFEASKSLNRLSTEAVQEIALALARRQEQSGRALLLQPDDLRANDYFISVNRYFSPEKESQSFSLEGLIQEGAAIKNELDETSRAVDVLINALASKNRKG